MKKILLMSSAMILFAFTAFAQKTVTGNISDLDGIPLPGATIIELGTNKGVSSDFDGNFSIDVKENATLLFSYIGYAPNQVEVGDQTMINIQLGLDTELEEVVVTGFGVISKQSFAGSAKVVSGDVIAKKSFTNVSQALAGEAAGVAVFNTSGQPGSSSTIRIRGFGSVNGSRDPLYIVDDAPFFGSLNDINPKDIKTVTVLKDASATALYGARGANGVIVVTTKRGSDVGTKFSVNVSTGTNFQGIPRYDVIRSPEEFMGISWEGIYQRGMIENAGDESLAVAYANENLFENNTNDDVSDISAIYNIWNTGDDYTPSSTVDVSQLINPATRSFRDGVTRRYNPEVWEDFAFQNAMRNEVNVTFSDRSDNSSVYTSFGFVDDIGYASNTDYSRLNGKIAATHSYKDFIRVNSSLNYTQSESNNNGQSSSSSSQFWWIDNLPSIYPLYRRDVTGSLMDDPVYGGYLFDYGIEDGRGFGFATNGIADSQINIVNNKNNSVNFNNDTRIDIAEGLTLENNFAYQYFMNDNVNLNEPFYSPANGEGGRVSRSRSETKNYNVRSSLRYKKSIDDFNFSGFVSHVASQYEFNYLYASGSKLVLPDGINIANTIVPIPGQGYTDEETTESYIANASVDAYDKYFLQATYTKDASSRFVNNKWGDFYAVGASWAMSKEDFLAGVDFIDFLKFKMSYGVIGNSGGVGFYPGYNLYSVNNLDDNIALAFDTKGNPDLTWEKSNQFNTGFEFELGGFMSGSIEYYKKITNDMFFDRRVGPSVGYALLKVNDGEMVNSGIEFDLDFNIVDSSDFKLTIGINGESFKNELTALPIDPSTGEEQKLDIDGRYGRTAGRSLYDWYMPVYSGVNELTGAAQWERSYVDIDSSGDYNDGDEIITNLTQYQNDNPSATILQDITEVYSEAADKFVNKTIIPDVRGSVRFNADYKNLSISALFNYSLGGYAYDSSYATLMDNDYAGTNNFHTDIRGRWMNPGDKTDIPRQDARKQIQQNAASTRFLTKADYFGLNNVRIGYDLTPILYSSLGVDKLEIFVTGDNLLFFSNRTGFNPSTSVTGGSSSYRYNPLSTLVFGINLNL